MEPRSFDRGDAYPPRPYSAPEHPASMEPRSFDRGDKTNKTTRTRKQTSFNGAAVF